MEKWEEKMTFSITFFHMDSTFPIAQKSYVQIFDMLSINNFDQNLVPCIATILNYPVQI